MVPTLVTGPTEEPVSLADLKAHLRVEHDDEDEEIFGMGITARMYIEERCWISLCTQTWRQVLDGWPSGPIQLSKGPILGITSVTYRDSDGATQTLSSSVYALLTGGRFALAYNQQWPTAALWGQEPFAITYTAGYGIAEAVPAPLKHALKLLVGHYYENREAVVVTQGITALAVPMAVDSLLYLYEVR